MESADPPVADSYWVQDGRFLAGRHPLGHHYDIEHMRRRLSALISAGFSVFIDLTQPGEVPDYREVLLEEAEHYGVQVKYHSYPFSPSDSISQTQIKHVLSEIDAALSEKHRVYLHCRAGVGRTGLVAGCFLARHDKTGQSALDELQRLRAKLPNAWMASPDSDALRQMVANWKAGE